MPAATIGIDARFMGEARSVSPVGIGMILLGEMILLTP